MGLVAAMLSIYWKPRYQPTEGIDRAAESLPPPVAG
jgi:hypothetical protein